MEQWLSFNPSVNSTTLEMLAIPGAVNPVLTRWLKPGPLEGGRLIEGIDYRVLSAALYTSLFY